MTNLVASVRRRSMFWTRPVAFVVSSSLIASCGSSTLLPSPIGTNASAVHSLTAAGAHAAGRWLASEKPKPQSPVIFRLAVDADGTVLQTANGTRRVSTVNIFADGAGRKTSALCPLSIGGCNGTGGTDPTPSPATPPPAPAPTPQALSPIPPNLVPPNPNVTEVDYFYNTTGANVYVYFNDGTVDVGWLHGSEFDVWHPGTTNGIWNLQFVEAVDQNVYLTAQKGGYFFQSMNRAAASTSRSPSDVNCVVADAVGGALGAILGDIVGGDVGATIGAAIGFLCGGFGAVVGGLVGAGAGMRWGAIVGGSVGLVVADYLCHAIYDKNPGSGPGGTTGGGGSSGGSWGDSPPAPVNSDVCHSDNPPPECARRQAGPNPL